MVTVTLVLALLDPVLLCFIAGLSDLGRFDWRGSGPHEGSLPNKCQPHDAEHQLVVHSGAGTRWVKRTLSQILSQAHRGLNSNQNFMTIPVNGTPTTREKELMSKITLTRFTAAEIWQNETETLLLWMVCYRAFFELFSECWKQRFCSGLVSALSLCIVSILIYSVVDMLTSATLCWRMYLIRN